MSCLGNCTNCGNWTQLFMRPIQKFHSDIEKDQTLSDEEKHKKFNEFLDQLYKDQIYKNFLSDIEDNKKLSVKEKTELKKQFISKELPKVYVPYCCKINMMTTQDKHRLLLPHPRN